MLKEQKEFLKDDRHGKDIEVISDLHRNVAKLAMEYGYEVSVMDLNSMENKPIVMASKSK